MKLSTESTKTIEVNEFYKVITKHIRGTHMFDLFHTFLTIGIIHYERYKVRYFDCYFNIINCCGIREFYELDRRHGSLIPLEVIFTRQIDIVKYKRFQKYKDLACSNCNLMIVVDNRYICNCNRLSIVDEFVPGDHQPPKHGKFNINGEYVVMPLYTTHQDPKENRPDWCPILNNTIYGVT
jgi:hypothetical protein